MSPGGDRPAAPDQVHLTLHAQHLLQCVHDLHEVALGGHHRVNILVGRRRPVDDAGVLAALDASVARPWSSTVKRRLAADVKQIPPSSIPARDR